MINWIDINKKLPKSGEKILAWGIVPTLHGYDGNKFLGETEFLIDRFNLDNTGHCGLVIVTHWAEITAPNV